VSASKVSAAPYGRRPARLRTQAANCSAGSLSPGNGTEPVSWGFTRGGGRPGWTALHSRRFSEPVTVHRTHADGTVHSTLIITTKEAYDALMQAGPPVANPAWQAALDAIVRALLDPTPERVEEGRVAFDRLHHQHPSSQPRLHRPGS
jgi:hypothetical protein